MNDGEDKEGMREDKDRSYIVEKRKVREKGGKGRDKKEPVGTGKTKEDERWGRQGGNGRR